MEELRDYSLAHWGLERTTDYLRSMKADFNHLASYPMLGRSCEVRNGYRQYPSLEHLVFYRITGVTIEIIRILHQSRDSSNAL